MKALAETGRLANVSANSIIVGALPRKKMLERFIAFVKASPPIEVTLAGIVIDLREDVAPNASLPIDVTVLGIVTETRSWANPKVAFPIDVIPFWITIEVRPLP